MVVAVGIPGFKSESPAPARAVNQILPDAPGLPGQDGFSLIASPNPLLEITPHQQWGLNE